MNIYGKYTGKLHRSGIGLVYQEDNKFPILVVAYPIDVKEKMDKISKEASVGVINLINDPTITLNEEISKIEQRKDIVVEEYIKSFPIARLYYNRMGSFKTAPVMSLHSTQVICPDCNIPLHDIEFIVWVCPVCRYFMSDCSLGYVK